jgi:hypothetical protein
MKTESFTDTTPIVSMSNGHFFGTVSQLFDVITSFRDIDAACVNEAEIRVSKLPVYFPLVLRYATSASRIIFQFVDDYSIFLSFDAHIFVDL